MLGRTHTRISRLGLSGLLTRLSARSRFELIGEARKIFRAVAIAVGISVSLSSAGAETEEVSGRDERLSDYSGYTFTRDSLIDFLANTYGSNTARQDDGGSTYDMPYGGAKSRRPPTDNKDTTTHWDAAGQSTYLDSFGGVSIPDAIWSLDGRSDLVSGGSELEIELGGHDSWTGDFIVLWTNMSANATADVLLTPPPQFQVASCGGSSSEHSNLEHCNVSYSPTTPYRAVTNVAEGESAVSTTAISTSTQEKPPDTIHDLSPLMPPGVNDFVVQGDLAYLSIARNPCDGILMTCATIQIDPPTSLSDSTTPPSDPPTPPSDPPTPPSDPPTPPSDPPTPPIDSPVPLVDSPAPPDSPDPVIPIGDPVPVSNALPIYFAPVAPSVPETSTWIMMMIGVGVIVIAGRRRSRNAVKQCVVGTVYKYNQKSFSTSHHVLTPPCDKVDNDDAEARLPQTASQ